MTGDAGYLQRIVVPDIEALERFILDHLTQIAGIKNLRSGFAQARDVQDGAAD